MGLTYLGPVDGHDMRQLGKVLQEAKRKQGPVLIHVLTEKAVDMNRRCAIRPDFMGQHLMRSRQDFRNRKEIHLIQIFFNCHEKIR